MHSDITLENDSLSCDIIHFSFKLTNKKCKLLNPPLPPGHFSSKFLYFPQKVLTLSQIIH